MTVRDGIGPAIRSATRSGLIADCDRAAARLALRYGQLLDDARGTDVELDVFVKVGPKLLQALAALGLTPAARRELVDPPALPPPREEGSSDEPVVGDELAEQRRRARERRTRPHGTAAMDASAPAADA